MENMEGVSRVIRHALCIDYLIVLLVDRKPWLDLFILVMGDLMFFGIVEVYK